MAPKVSIGMPVHNGANYIRQALDSILAQTFTDFELIISDNASTDETEEICRRYAVKDSRIRYYRQEVNLGAAKNFNLTVELSSGRYFKWAAHDDTCDPSYLQRCIEVLDRDSSVVLCFSRTIINDYVNNRTDEYIDDLALLSDRPYERYRRYHERVRHGHECHPIFGVIRSDVLRRTSLIGGYVSSDRVLLGELALYGKFYEIPEFLFYKRNHPFTSNNAFRSFKTRGVWFAPETRGKLQMTRWRMLVEYYLAIRKAPISAQEKALCCLQLGRWIFWYSKWLGKDLLKALIWPFLPWSIRTKDRKEIKARSI